jgi:hypothetical protein
MVDARQVNHVESGRSGSVGAVQCSFFKLRHQPNEVRGACSTVKTWQTLAPKVSVLGSEPVSSGFDHPVNLTAHFPPTRNHFSCVDRQYILGHTTVAPVGKFIGAPARACVHVQQLARDIVGENLSLFAFVLSVCPFLLCL